MKFEEVHAQVGHVPRTSKRNAFLRRETVADFVGYALRGVANRVFSK